MIRIHDAAKIVGMRYTVWRDRGTGRGPWSEGQSRSEVVSRCRAEEEALAAKVTRLSVAIRGTVGAIISNADRCAPPVMARWTDST